MKLKLYKVPVGSVVTSTFMGKPETYTDLPQYFLVPQNQDVSDCKDAEIVLENLNFDSPELASYIFSIPYMGDDIFLRPVGGRLYPKPWLPFGA